MNTIKILFFASLKELTGEQSIQMEVPEDTSVSKLKELLAERFTRLRPALGSALVSVNQEFAFDDDTLPPGGEVAFFPPVSGGDQEPANSPGFPEIYSITSEPLDLDELVAAITLPSTGAACIFTGMVRGLTNRGAAHETSYLEYEAYQPMAEAKMRQVAQEIRQQWPTVEGIAIVQRVGRLPAGKPTVLIACTAPHRDTGVFEAARYGIDRLKEIVPVWKKEVGPAGESWIEGEYLPTRQDSSPDE
jgi:MoaE-MoaD fusion protein